MTTFYILYFSDVTWAVVSIDHTIYIELNEHQAEHLAEYAKELGLTVRTRSILATEIYTAEEMFEGDTDAVDESLHKSAAIDSLTSEIQEVESADLFDLGAHLFEHDLAEDQRKFHDDILKSLREDQPREVPVQPTQAQQDRDFNERLSALLPDDLVSHLEMKEDTLFLGYVNRHMAEQALTEQGYAVTDENLRKVADDLKFMMGRTIDFRRSTLQLLSQRLPHLGLEPASTKQQNLFDFMLAR